MDVLEQRTDTLYSELQELLQNNKQARLEMQMERLATASSSTSPAEQQTCSVEDGHTPEDKAKSSDEDPPENK